jgi:hypothetical protein
LDTPHVDSSHRRFTKTSRWPAQIEPFRAMKKIRLRDFWIGLIVNAGSETFGSIAD